MKDIKDKFVVKAIGVNMDVSNGSSIQSGIKQASDHFGEINVLINNAGINIRIDGGFAQGTNSMNPSGR